jgi:hypothetical protein
MNPAQEKNSVANGKETQVSDQETKRGDYEPQQKYSEADSPTLFQQRNDITPQQISLFALSVVSFQNTPRTPNA